ncbi:putative ammonium transporter sll1017 [Cotesia glomerata]|uniref:putative ammonium transporter sll1017 n=1 Tax=Cotesia glomerata TaxID=32391 RepID=UPI001D02FD35|nr:putative ammonium transporter sll1017 [Cotesia glomerata]
MSDDIDSCYTSDSDIGFRQLDTSESPGSNNNESNSPYNISVLLPVVRIILVIFLRIGFTLVQIGSVPITNVNLILLQNIVDFCWVSLVYIILGSVIAYTGDIVGVVGGGHWIGDKVVNKEEAVIGWQAIMIASSIATTCMIGRTHTIASIIIGIVLSGIVQPFIIHWTWTAKGWMSWNSLRGHQVPFRDFGGSTVVHIVGGLTGLIGCSILGRRILKLRDLDKASIAIGSIGTTFIGHLFIILGLESLFFSNKIEDNGRLVSKWLSRIFINNLLTVSMCALVTIALHFLMRDPFNHWTVMRCIQAVTAGVVVISAGVDIYTPSVALAIGFVGGILFYLVTKAIFKTPLEDYCNIIAIHVVCALMGSFVALFFYGASHESYGYSVVLLDALWHLICIVSIISFVSATVTPMFLILDCLGLLRNRSEYLNHLRSTAAQERRHRSFGERLFRLDSETVFIQPGQLNNQEFQTESVLRPSRIETVARVEIPDQNLATQNVFNNNFETFKESIVEQKLRKARQVHTISSATDTVEVDHGSYKTFVIGDHKKINETIIGSKNLTTPTITYELINVNDYYNNNSLQSSPKVIEQDLSYKLHRTLNSLDLKSDSVIQDDVKVNVLVEPQFCSCVNSDSEDDDYSNSFNKKSFDESQNIKLAMIDDNH